MLAQAKLCVYAFCQIWEKLHVAMEVTTALLVLCSSKDLFYGKGGVQFYGSGAHHKDRFMNRVLSMDN